MIAFRIKAPDSIFAHRLDSLKNLFRSSTRLETAALNFRIVAGFSVLAVLACALPAWADQPGISTFDPSGSIATSPAGINPGGVIAGTYNDASGAQHGFVRANNGTVTPFEYPMPAVVSFFASFTFINPAGVITGTYNGADGNAHSFVRSAHGTMTSLDLIDATTGTFVGTNIVGINPGGVITGYYAGHGFVRAPDGTVTTFDPAGSTNTSPVGINPTGVIAGTYTDANQVTHGFVRAPNGAISMFDPMGSMVTSADFINPAGVIAGIYFDADFSTHGFVRAADGAISTFELPAVAGVTLVGGNLAGISPDGTVTGYGLYFTPQFFIVSHGFVRAPDGTVTAFDPPGSTITTPVGINPEGMITGTYFDSSGQHGFLRARNGTITTVDAPNSTGTGVAGINPEGVITGSYTDSGFMAHGFVFRGHN